MFGRRASTLAVALALAACAGNVEVKPDANSGEDFERAGAQELFLDKLVDDYVDYEGGDATDWKFFKVKSKGILELTVYWDDYRDIDAIIDVRDRFGVLIDSRRHSHELEKDQIDKQVEPGTHFIRIHATKGASVYTIEANFKPFDFEAQPVRPVAVDEEGAVTTSLIDYDTPSPRPRAHRSPRPVKRRGGRPAARGGRPPRPVAAAEQTGPAIAGTIIRVVPGPRGGSVLTLNVGRKDGVTMGMKGHIVGFDGKPLQGGGLEVTTVTDDTAQAKTNVKPAEMGDRRSVRLYPR